MFNIGRILQSILSATLYLSILFCVVNSEISRSHLDGPCKLWWPLNHTYVHFLPDSPSLAMDELVLICDAPEAARNEADSLDMPDKDSFESLVSMSVSDQGDVVLERKQLSVSNFFENDDNTLTVFKFLPPWRYSEPLILPVSVPLPGGAQEHILQTIKICYSSTECVSTFTLQRNVTKFSDMFALRAKFHTTAPRPPPMVHTMRSRDSFGAWLPYLLSDLALTRPLAVAEVGVQTGDFSLRVLQPQCGAACTHWLLVDPWDLRGLSPEDYVDAANTSPSVARKHLDIVQGLIRELRKQSSNSTFTLEQESSLNVARSLQSNPEANFWKVSGRSSLDVVYLDARHDYISVVEDICAWFPLVTPGGLLSGHDYVRSRFLHRTLFTVKQAVDAFVNAMWLELQTTGEVEENFPSWYVYKPHYLTNQQQHAFECFCAAQRVHQ